MIISIASGKGGTGKTTVSTSLAVSIEGDVQLLDCDVEEPNAHLFLKPDFKRKESFATTVPEIDKEKCTYCAKCDDLCQFKAIAVAGEVILTFPELCHSCGGCFKVCPEDAIMETGREVGTVELGYRNGIEFVHGRLRIGEAMSPPLIRQVRTYTDPDKVTIIDAPPGTSCPVIESMRDTDFVLLITEPTPFGLHDLKLALGAVGILDIPCGLVINRCDIGDDKVETYAKENNLPILMQIPFDRGIAEAYSRGEILAEAFPAWRERFRQMLQGIETLISQRNKTE
jgi:MinD superfamily P-loop ATPase